MRDLKSGGRAPEPPFGRRRRGACAVSVLAFFARMDSTLREEDEEEEADAAAAADADLATGRLILPSKSLTT